MNQGMVIQLAKDAFTVGMLICGPILLASLVVGMAISILQAVTQIQEMTLTFVPKALAVSLVVLLFGPWMIDTMAVYTTNLLVSLPTLVR